MRKDKTIDSYMRIGAKGKLLRWMAQDLHIDSAKVFPKTLARRFESVVITWDRIKMAMYRTARNYYPDYEDLDRVFYGDPRSSGSNIEMIDTEIEVLEGMIEELKAAREYTIRVLEPITVETVSIR